MSDDSRSQWYIVNASGEREGPFSTDQIVSLRLGRRIVATTPCWRQGMEEWLPLAEVPSLMERIDSHKRHVRRRILIAAGSVVCAAAVVVGVIFLVTALMLPEEVARAEKMVAEQRYLDAGKVLRPYLAENDCEDLRAVTLMGVAALGHYAAEESDGGTRRSGFGFVVRRQQLESVKGAREMLKRAFDRDPSRKAQAAQYLDGMIENIPEDVPDVCDRCIQLSTLLADLEIVDPAALARQTLEKFRHATGGIQQAGCSQEFAETVLLGDPTLGDEFVSAVYRFRRETPAGKRLGEPGNTFVSWVQHNPKLAPALGKGLLKHAGAASAAGNYGECDDALGAVCRIDDASAPTAHKLWLASLTSQLDSRGFADPDSRRQLVGRINSLAARSESDLQAVAELYLAHRTELISLDPQIESGFSFQFRQVIKDQGDVHFLRSGEELLKAGNYAAAVAELKRIARGSSQFESAAALLEKAEFQLHLQTAEKALQDRDHPTAERAFRQALTLRPDDETALAGLEDCRQAAEQRSIQEDVERAKSLCETGQLDEARSLLDKLLAEHPGHKEIVAESLRVNEKLVDARLQAARDLVRQAKLDSAESALQGILADLPENGEATKMLDDVQTELVAADCSRATALIADKRFVEARTVLSHALKRRPNDARTIALNEQVSQSMANPETTDLSGTWVAPRGIRLVLAQNGDHISVAPETKVGNYTTWEGQWTREGKALSGSFRVAVQGMTEPALIDVRAEIQDSKTINVSWEETTWRNRQKTRGRGYGVIPWVRAASDTTAREPHGQERPIGARRPRGSQPPQMSVPGRYGR